MKNPKNALNRILEIGPYGENFSRTSSSETKNGKLPIHTVLEGGFLGGAEGVSYRCTRVVERALDAPTTAPNLICRGMRKTVVAGRTATERAVSSARRACILRALANIFWLEY